MTLPDNNRNEMVYHDNDEAGEQFALAICGLRQNRQFRQFVSELSAHAVGRPRGAFRRARGVRFGRHTTLPQQQIAKLHERQRQGAGIRVLMNDYRIAKATVYRYLEGVSPAQPEEFPEFV